MKKYGKYEKRPEVAAVEQKPKKVKNALLQTYLTSLLSMVLCVTMFFGTSYAWFSSEVNNAENEIYIGTLDVGLFKQADPEDLDLANGNNKLFDGNIRWEPGHTSLETVNVVNEGDLAFKYVMTFTDGKLDGNADPNLLEVAKNFDVWVYYHEDDKAPTAKKFSEITAEDSGWEPAGSLDALLSGDVVLDGDMEDVRKEGQDEEDIIDGTTDGKTITHTYTIALHMKEDADAAVMGKKISLNVKLVAYQKASEEDAFGAQYDQMVATADELKEAFKNGGAIALAADIDVKDVQTLAAVPTGKEVELYLNGHKINAELKDPESGSTELFYVHADGKLTIHGEGDIHVVAGKSLARTSALINNCGGTVVINGGKYTMEYGSYSDGYLLPVIIDNNSTLGESTVIINGGTFTHTRNMFRNFSNHSSEVASIVINGGVFNGEAGDVGAIWNQKPSANTPAGAGVVELNGGTFNYMTICTGFADENSKPAGVTCDNGIALGEWEADDSEWSAYITVEASEG